MFLGRVVQLHQDFLNWSLYIRHDQFCRDGSLLQLHTVYGHVQPKKTVCSGMEVRAGEPVAVLDAYSRSAVPVLDAYSRSAVPLHLHFTVAWIPKSIPPDQLNWQMLSENQQIILFDPLAECEVEGIGATVRTQQ
ncbi:MAG: hypothetical protein D3903_21725 [Candidatus Electrothrix sp. GM3_4]|nr:hypothetical protein [Candidatus Electrothrix sp. GM3_4]